MGGGDPVVPGGGHGASENLLSLTLLPGSTATRADVTLSLSNLDPTLNLAGVGGISAEILFDPTWMTFSGFTANPLLGAARMLPLTSDPGRLLVALEGVSEGTLGTLRFDLSGTGNNGALVWDGTTFIGVDGTVLPDRVTATSGTDLGN